MGARVTASGFPYTGAFKPLASHQPRPIQASGTVLLMAQTRLASAIGACLALSLAACPIANAETVPTRFVLGGAEYTWLDKMPEFPLFNKYVTPNLKIGAGFYPGTPSVVIDYPGDLLPPGTIGQHIAIGVDNIDAAIKAATGPVIVVGQSEGTVVADGERARLENDPAAPPADQLSFLLFNHPMRGMANTLFPDGFHIPILDVTVTEPVESRYNTAVVTHEYDFFGDFPARPWNLLALVNSVAGFVFLHQIDSDVPADIPPENITATVNSKGATDTTYFVPTRNLPLTELLRIAGVPDRAVDRLDNALRPTIDRAYSRNDEPGDPRPYLSHGTLQRHPGTGAAVKAPRISVKPAARKAHRDRRGI